MRIVPIAGKTNRYRVSLMPCEDGVVAIRLLEAGDSIAVRRNDIAAFTPGRGTAVNLDNVRLTKGKRLTLDVTSTGHIGGRSWQVHAKSREV